MSAPQIKRVHEVEEGSSPQGGELVFHKHSPASLIIPEALVEQIREQVEEGVRLVPRQGAEIGGLLLGPKEPVGQIVVEQVVPIATEYHFGPSFRLSPSDIENLERLVESLTDTHAVVGFYRSWTRGEERFRDSDEEVRGAIERTRRSYAAAFRYILVLRPISKEVISAEVAERKNGAWTNWQSSKLRREEPHLGLELTEAKALRAERPTPAIPKEQRVPQVRRAPEGGPAAGAARGFQLTRQWLYGATAVLLLGGVLIYTVEISHHQTPPPKQVAQPSAVMPRTGFAANPEGGMWRLTWNWDVVAALKPSGAMLLVRDGDSEQQIPLTTADLASGTVFYTPKSANLLFGLRVLSPGAPPVEEQVRVLSPVVPQEEPAEVRIVTAQRERTLRPFSASNPLPKPAVSLAEPPPTLSLNSVPSATALASLGTAVPSTTPPAPPSAASAAATRLARPAVRATPVAAAIPTRLPEIKPAEIPASPGNLTPAPPQPPVVINRVLPQFPASMRALMTHATTVQVRIQIDTKGKVTEAQPVEGKQGSLAPLVQTAVDAAREWTFRPATTHGVPVPSESVITFNFTP
jgi:TonB family protein